MQPIKLATSDQRMLELMEYAVRHGIAETETQYWEKISFNRGNLSNVRKGLQGFTREHIRKACLLTGANANWILDIDGPMFRDQEGKTVLQLLQEATAMLEAGQEKGRPKLKAIRKAK